MMPMQMGFAMSLRSLAAQMLLPATTMRQQRMRTALVTISRALVAQMKQRATLIQRPSTTMAVAIT